MDSIKYEGVQYSPFQLAVKLIKEARDGVPTPDQVQKIRSATKGSKEYWDLLQDILGNWQVTHKKS